MILQRLDYSIANLLHSSDAVAICPLNGEKLKDMILTVRERGWGLVVVEAATGERFLVFAAPEVHQGNLVGDVRRWSREFGYQFFLKLSNEEFFTPRDNAFVLPDGREIEIGYILTRSSNFTHWGLQNAKKLPVGYVPL